ncbi:ABC transporter permease [Chitinophaga filiformis]|uniref:Peptide/nickel transport system permease protein n=1 Tax=Chitinophaga filiformis TaxID=104663 RepID=A0A1G7UH53_CHIFI|nr:ABC transporter permease [Chitinophaga filiformis]SDG46886.1 peptide/nickel transport system permease protein [Chitinophaga filiformis]
MSDSNSRSSFGSNAWKRLRRNTGAVAGMLLIVIAVIVSVLAYQLAPDGTPYANRMMLETSGQKPGFRIHVLAMQAERQVSRTGFFSRLINGQPDTVTYIPVRSWRFAGNDIVVAKYMDEEETVTERYNLGKVLFAKDMVPGNRLKQWQQEIVSNRIKERTYWLGTDKFGRDILSRLLVGTRVSLSVGCIAVIISLTIGIVLGAVAGYFRGVTDEVIMWLVNVIWAVPTLLLVFAITLALGKGFWQVFIAVGLTMWVNVARIIRGQVMALRELPFIEATRALGFGHARTIGRHILPNILGPVMVVAAGNFATAIVVEAGLSFLGVGVQPPQPSWGLMIKENYNFIITHNPMLALIPGLAIMVMVLAFNLLGNGLRDAMDVRQ